MVGAYHGGVDLRMAFGAGLTARIPGRHRSRNAKESVAVNGRDSTGAGLGSYRADA
jgi:hypothetical protein